MPVWHQATADLRASDDLVVIGITQEQHPDRCRLYAQWQGIDWPILWDPLNLTRSAAVPLILAVDEHGVVQSSRMRPQDLGQILIEPESFPAPAEDEQLADVRPELLADGAEAGYGAALAHLLYSPQADPTPAIATLKRLSQDEAAADMPELFFHLGVAHRLRYDSPFLEPGDFQASIDGWGRALELDPNQYIWRRRIQQYGPRLDKPYPFYDWIDKAAQELRARGQEPHPVAVPLSGAEIAGGTNALPANPGEHRSPDPGRKITRDEGRLVKIESSTVRHTGKPGAIVRAATATRVHVVLRPDQDRDVHWTNDAGPALVWVAVPRGWRIERNLYDLPVRSKSETSAEVRSIDFEVVPDEDAENGPQHLMGYALYYICEGEEGRCLYLRQDFEIPLELP